MINSQMERETIYDTRYSNNHVLYGVHPFGGAYVLCIYVSMHLVSIYVQYTPNFPNLSIPLFKYNFYLPVSSLAHAAMKLRIGCPSIIEKSWPT